MKRHKPIIWQNVIFDYVRLNDKIMQALLEQMVENFTNYRRGSSYCEMADLIENHVNENFEPVYGTENRTVEQTIVYVAIKSVDYISIAAQLYESVYNMGVLHRITEADAYDECEKFQQEYADNEAAFFEDKYLQIFSSKMLTNDTEDGIIKE